MTAWLAVLAVALVSVGVVVGSILETNDRINGDIESLVLCRQLTEDLTAARSQ